MENASKALIIAAEVLLGVLLLTLMVFAFRGAATFSQTVDKNIETKNLQEFNNQFEKFKEQKTLTAQDVISIGNIAKEYNNKIEQEHIKVTVTGVESKYSRANQLSDESTYTFIETYSQNSFAIDSMQYNENTGKIQKITLKKVQ